MHRLAALALAAVAALLLAVFFVFRTLFTDGPADPVHPEYLVAHGLTLLAYAVTLLLLARSVSPSPWCLAVAAPGAVLAIAYQDAGLGLRMLTLASVLVGSLAGWWAGVAWRRASPAAD